MAKAAPIIGIIVPHVTAPEKITLSRDLRPFYIERVHVKTNYRGIYPFRMLASSEEFIRLLLADAPTRAELGGSIRAFAISIITCCSRGASKFASSTALFAHWYYIVVISVSKNTVFTTASAKENSYEND
jgi:hypothetical protein